MELIKINKNNIDLENLCCAIADKKCQPGVLAKKEMILRRLEEGFVFCKLNERGKVFIEYCPGENTWLPVNAVDYMVINCFWVAGSFKGNGYGKKLLEECEKDAVNKKKKGIVVITSKKKRPFISDKKFFIKYGFEVCDFAFEDFELLVKKFDQKTLSPSFNNVVKQNCKEDGLVLYYSDHCPFNNYYVAVLKEEIANYKIKFKCIKIEDKKTGQQSPLINGCFSLFYNGRFLTQEILTVDKFRKLITQLGL